jgi:acyl-CoA thioesterase-1
MQDDGIHANAKGQPQMLENVWPTLKPLLVAPRKPAS